MTANELQTIKESVGRVEKFAVGYPRKIVCNDVRWQPYFDLQYGWAFSRLKEISGDNPPVEQMKML